MKKRTIKEWVEALASHDCGFHRSSTNLYLYDYFRSEGLTHYEAWGAVWLGRTSAPLCPIHMKDFKEKAFVHYNMRRYGSPEPQGETKASLWKAL